MPQWILTGMMLHVPAGMGLLRLYMFSCSPQSSNLHRFEIPSDCFSGLLGLSFVDNGGGEKVLVDGVANDFFVYWMRKFGCERGY